MVQNQQAAEQQKVQLQTQIVVLQSQMTQAQAVITQLTNERDTAVASIQAVTNEKKMLESKLAIVSLLQSQLTTATAQYEAARTENANIKNKLDEMTSQINEMTRKYFDLRSSVKNLLGSVKSSITDCEDDLDSIENGCDNEQYDEDEYDDEYENENRNSGQCNFEKDDQEAPKPTFATGSSKAYSVDIGSSWAPYSSSVCAQIDSAIAEGKSSFQTTIRNQSYTIDVVQMQQVNDEYGTTRKIRCDTPAPVAPAPVAPAPVAPAPPVAPTPVVTPSESSTGTHSFVDPNAIFSSIFKATKIVPMSSKTPTQVSYFDRGTWVAFDAKTASSLITQYLSGASKFSFQFGSHTYSVDFTTMTQTNLSTRQTRRVRFDTEQVAMFSDNSYWFPYDKKSSDAIVAGATTGSSVTVTVGSTQYLVDTVSMTQVNTTTGVTRDIKLA
jgi:hypothetical protein